MEESEYTYKSLDEIRRRKIKIEGKIQAKEKNIRHLWNEIFYKKENATFQTPSKKISRVITTGAGIFDGIMLGFKLYNRLRRK